MMKLIDNNFCRPDNPLFLAEEEGFYRFVLINDGLKKIIIETRSQEEKQNILDIIPKHSQKGNNMHNLLLSNNNKKIDINSEYSISIQNMNKNLSHISHICFLYKNEHIANRFILLSPLLQTYITKEVAINGHGGIGNPEMRGKGHGFKLYRYIDEFIGLPSVPSSAPGVFGNTSEEALRVFSKLKEYRITNNLVHPEIQLNTEELEHYKGMHDYLNTSSKGMLQVMDDIFIYKDLQPMIEWITGCLEDYKLEYDEDNSDKSLEDALNEFCDRMLPNSAQKYYLKEYHDILLSQQQIDNTYHDIYTKAFRKAGLKYNNCHKNLSFI